MEKRDNRRWLKERCEKGHLSLRQAVAKTGLSHATIGDIMKGKHPLPETIRKLAQGFGEDGRLALEDQLIVLILRNFSGCNIASLL